VQHSNEDVILSSGGCYMQQLQRSCGDEEWIQHGQGFKNLQQFIFTSTKISISFQTKMLRSN